MGKVKQLLSEKKIVSSWRLQRLAGILKEEIEPELLIKARELTGEWLKKEGKNKIYTDLVSDLIEYFASGQHEDGDEEGRYYVHPSEETYAKGTDLLDKYLESIAGMATDPVLKQTLLDGEAPPEVYDAMAQELEIEARKGFEDAADEAKDEAGDTAAYRKDPYSYYGVRRSDFY